MACLVEQVKRLDLIDDGLERKAAAVGVAGKRATEAQAIGTGLLLDDPPLLLAIDLSVEQARMGDTVKAIGYLEPAVCDGSAQRFEVTLTGTGGRRFQRGAATWSASGYVEGDTGTQTVHVPPTPIALTK